MNSKTTARRKSISTLPMLVGALFLGFLTVGSTSASAAPTLLTLINGWSDFQAVPNSYPAVVIFNGIVHFKGTMVQKQGNNPLAFVLPAGFRPATVVFAPISLLPPHKGRLVIYPNGQVVIQAEHSFTYAQSYTALDGASFAPSDAGFTPLTLINGWTNAPSSTSNAAVENINGIVHFKGAIATAGSSAEPFVLPAGFRPAAMVFLPVDLCNAANGRLVISPSGVVEVQAQNTFSSAQCLTSLDGAWFAAAGAPGFKNLKVLGTWKGAPFGTGKPAVHGFNGNHVPVYLKGAVAGADNYYEKLFVLPVADRPRVTVQIGVDLCDGSYGVLNIFDYGDVQLDARNSHSNATCFTSLDGVSFIK